ncbi:MAG: hypothetical protein ACK42A_09720 [Pyrinomonadaceae bacterium]
MLQNVEVKRFSSDYECPKWESGEAAGKAESPLIPRLRQIITV